MLTNISMADFYEKYQHEHLDLIDVREVHEFQAGHAPGAKNLPLSTLEQGYKELKPDHEYYVICQGGVRSASTCQFLISLYTFSRVALRLTVAVPRELCRFCENVF